MKQKWIKLGSFGLLTMLLLGSCGKLDGGTTNLNTSQVNKEATITTGRVNKNAYQSLMVDGKYVTSVARGLSASRLNSNYNLTNFEEGLLRLSQDTFSPEKYYMQEGQKITEEMLRNWYGRRTEGNPTGLNPIDEASPMYVQQVEEYDFLSIQDQSLAGISIGIAMNSFYYTENDSIAISDEDVASQGKKAAEKILEDLRGVEGLENMPITLTIFQQTGREEVVGGRYLYRTISKEGSKTIDSWEDINESYVALPVRNNGDNDATNTDVSSKFNDFKSTVQGFFPNLSGVSGTAHFINGTLNKLSISITSKYYSRAEVQSFTQYIGKLAESDLLNVSGDVEIVINSLEGPQAFVARDAGSTSIYSRVFN